MVLAELGSKVAIALRKMTQATIVDETVMNDMLQEICRALMQADVNVKQVKQMRESIKKNVNVEELVGAVHLLQVRLDRHAPAPRVSFHRVSVRVSLESGSRLLVCLLSLRLLLLVRFSLQPLASLLASWEGTRSPADRVLYGFSSAPVSICTRVRTS